MIIMTFLILFILVFSAVALTVAGSVIVVFLDPIVFVLLIVLSWKIIEKIKSKK